MSDYERYGDYNNIDEIPGEKKPLFIRILLWIIAAFLIFVVGFLAVRMIQFNRWPKDSVSLVYTETLTAACEESGGDPVVKTQPLRAPYDDAKEGNFFVDGLLVIDEAEEIQLTLRYSLSSLERLSEKCGTALDPEEEALFTFRLTDEEGSVYDTLSYRAFYKKSMYRYQKLVFEGIDLPGAEWLRLEIFLGEEKIGTVAVYENNADYHAFKPYRLSKAERFQ